MAKESEIIAAIRKNARAAEGLAVGIGDDAAVIRHHGEADILACCDLSVEGVHFRGDWATPEWIGRKSLNVTLSDVAAMGGTPRFAMISLALPRASGATLADELMRGIFAAADGARVAIIGGDTSSSPNSLVIDTSVIGECARGRAVRRGGARPGDLIFVTGSLGASQLGLRLLETGYRLSGDGAEDHVDVWRRQALRKHLLPEPRLRFGAALGERGLATAMIDVSDGLSTDLSHLLEESQCGARLRAEIIPIAESAANLAAASPDLDPLQLALHGGEEYELVFTSPPEHEAAIVALGEALGLPVTAIGQITSGGGLTIEARGKVEPLLPAGYEHHM